MRTKVLALMLTTAVFTINSTIAMEQDKESIYIELKPQKNLEVIKYGEFAKYEEFNKKNSPALIYANKFLRKKRSHLYGEGIDRCPDLPLQARQVFGGGVDFLHWSQLGDFYYYDYLQHEEFRENTY